MDLDTAAKRLAAGAWTVVPGLFDPLTTVQAERLAKAKESGRKLAAIVLDDAGALLPAEARAALMASLQTVDLVTIASPQQWQASLPPSGTVRVLEDPQGEAKRSAEFVKFVIDRQNAAKTGAQQS